MTKAINIITDIHSLIQAVLYVNERLLSQNWWRGQSCDTWSLKPSVFRGNRGYEFERNINIRFIQKATARYPNPPAINDDYSWLFLMQHHGLPTRLLDWTESPLYACFFAVNDEKWENNDSALYAINPYLLNESQVGFRIIFAPSKDSCDKVKDDPLIKVMMPAFYRNIQDVNNIIALSTVETDIREMIQLSAFTIHGSGLAVEELPAHDEFLIKFIIPRESKKTLRKQLIDLGVRESILFPDLDHLAKECSRLFFFKFKTEDNEKPKSYDPYNNSNPSTQ